MEKLDLLLEKLVDIAERFEKQTGGGLMQHEFSYINDAKQYAELIKNNSLKKSEALSFIKWYNKEYPFSPIAEWLADDYHKTLNK